MELVLASFVEYKSIVSCFWMSTSGKHNQSGLKKPIGGNFDLKKAEFWNFFSQNFSRKR